MGQRTHWVELTRTVGKLLSFLFYFEWYTKRTHEFRIVYVHVTLMLMRCSLLDECIISDIDLNSKLKKISAS